jgi:hypothetical protein
LNTPKKKHSFDSNTRILLTGVFGPYAQDDEYGSRRDNPMELYNNQVTRVQGPFNLRMFHRTFGLLMIEANIDAPTTILEFATLDRFIDELKSNSYDMVGINSIYTNTGKVKKMCEEIRKHLPDAVIVVGGHIASREDLADVIDTDYICKGDGIQWFRKFLGQDENAPIKHPAVTSCFGTRILGITTHRKTAGTLIPSVGCPLGCNFCSTSALFGGKGKSVVFFKTGDELFSILCQIEEKLGVDSFFVMDENFLLYKDRALRLLELMEEHGKSWDFNVFSSARVLESYTIDQLIGLGISWVWLGIEGRKSTYTKLDGVDTRQLVKKLQSNGIRVLGSTIIGLDNHTPENIGDVIDYAVSHETDFHQFMLYWPLPGTPLYQELKKNKKLIPEEECPVGDSHGQKHFNFKHQHIKNGMETGFLLKAFEEDFRVNGPSLARIIRTTLLGWQKHKNHPNPRIAQRFKSNRRGLDSDLSGVIWAMTRWFKTDPKLLNKLKELLAGLYAEFGLKTRIKAPLMGLYILHMVRKESERLAQGWTYEPGEIYEKNARALELEKGTGRDIKERIPGVV